MIILNISICLRCQKGGEPASRVYMMTPVLHLAPGGGEEGRRASWSSHRALLPSQVIPAVGASLSLRVTSLPPTHSHVHLLPIARVVIIHGALNDLRGQVTGRPTDLCRDSFHQNRSAEALGRGKPKETMEKEPTWCLGWDSLNTGLAQGQGQSQGAGSCGHPMGDRQWPGHF